MAETMTATPRSLSRSSCSTISAMVVLPAPESPVNHNVNPRSFCSMRFLQTVRPLLELVVYIPGDGLSGPGADGQALFLLKASHHLSSVLRRGARYASGVPTRSRKERACPQSASPSVPNSLHTLFCSPGSAVRS